MAADKQAPAVNRLFFAGVLSGGVCAAVFNPWDRALYLSVLHERAFCRLANWRNPFQGIYQSFLQRTLSSGLYFPLIDLSIPLCEKNIGKTKPGLVNFIAGNMAGKHPPKFSFMLSCLDDITISKQRTRFYRCCEWAVF
jgi:hypothetical protein